ncbi:MAG: hypothetical protein H6524_11540 [Actinobacteria bacterium]|nr:hypothetical protein [Actinomycetota bacterium]MCO5300736.1 hypothetical protein [Candidatus Nanopelagicales bacterium]HPE14201.1 hypothetical protein [Actinomycetota bacterium]
MTEQVRIVESSGRIIAPTRGRYILLAQAGPIAILELVAHQFRLTRKHRLPRSSAEPS